MDTNRLKRFAQDTRRKLLEQVSAKLDYVATSDTPELREKAALVAKIKEEINKIGKKQLVDKVAYTWFNRLVALRYMDCHEYQPLGIRIVSPLPNQVSPQILHEAIGGNIPDELTIDKKKVFSYLDGSISSKNAENDAYRLLLIAACNHLNRIFPFLFERIDDFTELLLPDDLTSEFSVLHDVMESMSIEDCSQVEVIGWLYQFYISEKNDELISSKKKYETHELGPASQLFTPKWIVKYMVDNTLGQLWSEINPNSNVTSSLEFYIKPTYKDQHHSRSKRSIEDIKFFEPCVGSGHILSYAFDIFYKIYEEEGYNQSEIPEMIISKNLWGVDIDQRAAQLASFVLMMKGREKHARFFKKSIQPNIYYYENFAHDTKFEQATTIGSLIKVEPYEADAIKVETNTIFGETQAKLKSLYQLLGRRYDVVVTNPPYISSSRMEGELKQHVETNYPKAKPDLFSAFILRCLELTNEEGLTGYMTPFLWMFILSYEELREEIIDNHLINNLIQLEYSGFDGATVPVCTFTLRNRKELETTGSYIRLSDFKGAKNQEPKAKEAIKNRNCGWFYVANQTDFKRIPGSPIGYWLRKKSLDILSDVNKNKNYEPALNGLQTGNTTRFIRDWREVDLSLFKVKWFPYNKGGNYRKWYGNVYQLINWQNNGQELKDWKQEKLRKGEITANNSKCWNESSYMKKGVTWTDVTSGKNSFRILEEGTISDICAPFAPGKSPIEAVVFLNTKFNLGLCALLNPSLHFTAGDYNKLPHYRHRLEDVELAKGCVAIAKEDWDSREISWNFQQSELLRIKGQDLEEAFDLYKLYWKNKFQTLHRNEEQLNKQFIELYNLQNELSFEIPLDDITILKDEVKIEDEKLIFKSREVFSQFISYSVGCMFGRYSLDQKGLVLSNARESTNDYYTKIGQSKREILFGPDEDNIIPVLEDEWFEDDIVNKFYQFLKASFGEKNFRKNLEFLEEQIGIPVRKYFTKEFYADHIQSYKKRPIYWMFSSPKGHFNVLIYLHRYTSDTLNNILNSYLREFIEKLKTRKEQLKLIEVVGSQVEKTRAVKEMDKLELMLADCYDYERNILYPLAIERLEIDLDNGVLVNYNCFGKAVKEIKGLNDAKTKAEVKKFDWIDSKIIR